MGHILDVIQISGATDPQSIEIINLLEQSGMRIVTTPIQNHLEGLSLRTFNNFLVRVNNSFRQQKSLAYDKVFEIINQEMKDAEPSERDALMRILAQIQRER